MRGFSALSTFAFVDCSIRRVTASTSTLAGMAGVARSASSFGVDSRASAGFCFAARVVFALSADGLDSGVAATGAIAAGGVTADVAARPGSDRETGAASNVAGVDVFRLKANQPPAPAIATSTSATRSAFFDRPSDSVIVGGMRTCARDGAAWLRGGVRGRAARDGGGGAARRTPRSG